MYYRQLQTLIEFHGQTFEQIPLPQVLANLVLGTGMPHLNEGHNINIDKTIMINFRFSENVEMCVILSTSSTGKELKIKGFK